MCIRDSLTAIKRSGPITTAVLARQLGITVTAVRQQLHRLGEDGLVVHHPDPDGRGRPAHRYELTTSAEALFPKRYGDLTAELLGYLGGPQSPEVGQLFERRRKRRLDGATPRLADLSLDEQMCIRDRLRPVSRPQTPHKTPWCSRDPEQAGARSETVK